MTTAALLVPCHNARRFLPRLRTQADRLQPAFDEVLLADDGSTDSTADHAESMGFRILRLPKNLGPGGARNALAKASTAEWVHFHDVDDELAPDYLRQVRQMPLAQKDAIFHPVDFIDETHRSLMVHWRLDESLLKQDPIRCLLLQPMPTMSSFLRRETFLSAGGFNEKLRCFEDGDLHLRLAIRQARIGYLPSVLEWSLRGNGGAGADQDYCFQCRLQFLKMYAQLLAPSYHRDIGGECAKAAATLLEQGNYSAAEDAAEFASTLGCSLPVTRNPFLLALRPFVPSLTLLRLQSWWRRKTPPRTSL